MSSHHPERIHGAAELRVVEDLGAMATAVRALMHAAFGADFTDDDWEHALGGVHVVLLERGEIVAHAALVQRRLWAGERALEVGYVEAVAVEPARQGAGLGTTVMRALDPALAHAELGALSTGEHAFYERLGWERWQGTTWVRDPGGDRRTADEDAGIMVRRTPRTGELDLAAALVCEPRPGDDW